MSTTHEDKSNGKPRQRNRKGGQKAARGRNPKTLQQDEAPVDVMIASAEVPAGDTGAPVAQSFVRDVEPAVAVAAEEVAAADVSPTEAAVSANEAAPVNMQTIANAYRDYTRKSVQDNRRFVEQLMGVRSFDKAVEVQADFARQAYENFVAETQKICGLYGQLAGRAFRR